MRAFLDDKALPVSAFFGAKSDQWLGVGGFGIIGTVATITDVARAVTRTALDDPCDASHEPSRGARHDSE